MAQYVRTIDEIGNWDQNSDQRLTWMEDNDVQEIKLAWFGTADPSHYGIQYRPLPGLGRAEFFKLWWAVPFDRTEPEAGIYAISVSNIWELPLSEEERGVYAWFRGREPSDRVGHSILIYDVP